MPQFTREAYEQNQTLLKLLEDLASEKGASKAQISLAWMLAKKDWIVPIPGSRNLASLKENAQAADVTLTASEAAAIDAALNAIPMSAVYGGVVTKEKED
jgi:aryl-alcohol dehydrogenase-like predicted oxidoreductase